MTDSSRLTKALESVATTVKKITDQVEAEKATWFAPPLAEQKLREFLQTWPLYRRLTFKVAFPIREVSFPRALSMPCSNPACRDEPTTTWTLAQEFSNRPGEMQIYQCVHCSQAEVSFWLVARVSDEVKPAPTAVRPANAVPVYRTASVMKVGQLPGWSIAPPKVIERALDEVNLELYKKGLINMSQAYGVGALGYFRRVVENGVDALLDLVQHAAEADSDAAALEAIREARGKKNAEQKLQLAAEKVPASLRPGGINPLGVLYGNYSRGIHQESDEECLTIATELRDALEYVFGNLREQLEQAKAFRERITKRAGGS